MRATHFRILTLILACIGAAVFLCFAYLFEIGHIDGPSILAATRYLISGHSPYIYPALSEYCLVEIGNDAFPILTPPARFSLLALFAVWGYPLDVAVLVTCCVAAYISTIFIVVRQSAGKAPALRHKNRMYVIPVLVVFLPFILSIHLGKIGCIVLFFFVLFLNFSYRAGEELKDSFWGGFFLGLSIVKPKMLGIIYPVMLLQIIRTRKLKTFAGGALGSLTVALPPLFFVPEVYHDYFFQNPFSYAHTASLSQLLSIQLTSPPSQIIRFGPYFLMLLVVAVLLPLRDSKILDALSNRRTVLNLLLPLNILCLPFVWSYDLVILVPSIVYFLRLQLTKGYSIFRISALLLIIATLANVRHEMTMHKHWWYLVLLCLVCFYGYRHEKRIQIQN